MPLGRDSVIASRRLRTADRKRTVCRFAITGLGRHRLNAGHGVDAFQALQQALEGIRLMIDETGRKLSFLDMGHHFFPKYVPQYFGPEFERKLNQHVEREIVRFAKVLERRHKAGLRRPKR
jgi:hypothetical protein